MIKGFRKQVFLVVLFYSHYLKFYRENTGFQFEYKNPFFMYILG